MLPNGVDEATWRKALRVIGHPWREGQRCDRFDNDGFCAIHNVLTPHPQIASRWHDIPMPAVTDELVMGMLRRLVTERVEMDQAPPGDERYWILFPLKDGEPIFWGETFDAAIILATASLEGK